MRGRGRGGDSVRLPTSRYDPLAAAASGPLPPLLVTGTPSCVKSGVLTMWVHSTSTFKFHDPDKAATGKS